MAGQYNAEKHSRDKWIAVLIALGKKNPSWLGYSGAIATNFSRLLKKINVSLKLFGATGS